MAEPKEKFPKSMADWIKVMYPDYDAKLGLSKPHIPGQPERSDDADIATWRKEKMDEFRNHFGDQLNDIPKWQERFMRKFINRKRNLKAKLATSATNPIVSPMSSMVLFTEPPRTTAHKLFDEENSTKFSEEASKRREALGQSSQHHAGHWQLIASSAWKDLSDEERERWEEQARSIETAMVGSGDIYHNQDLLPFKLFSILSRLVGPQPHQVGCAAFHLLYAYWDADELLKMGRVQVADDEFMNTSFDGFLPDYATSVSKPWNDYCSKVVGSNRSVEYDTIFSKNDAGQYVLPVYDEENGRLSDLRIILKQFFEASWDLTWPRSAEMPGLPWADLIAAPSDYLRGDLCVGPMKISRPDTMPPTDLRALSEKINAHQRTFALSIFRSCVDIANARDHRTSLNQTQHEDSKDPEEILHEPTPPASPSLPSRPPCILTAITAEMGTQESSKSATSPMHPHAPSLCSNVPHPDWEAPTQATPSISGAISANSPIAMPTHALPHPTQPAPPQEAPTHIPPCPVLSSPMQPLSPSSYLTPPCQEAPAPSFPQPTNIPPHSISPSPTQPNSLPFTSVTPHANPDVPSSSVANPTLTPPLSPPHSNSAATAPVASTTSPILLPILPAKQKPKRPCNEGLGTVVDLGPCKRRQTHRAKGRAFNEVTTDEDIDLRNEVESDKRSTPEVATRGCHSGRGDTRGRGRGGTRGRGKWGKRG